MDKRKDVAREIARIYCRLTPAGVDALSKILVPVKVSKGDVVLSEGLVCRHMYFVERGMVRQYYYKSGRDVTEHFSYEGRIVVCIESFLKQEPSRLIVEALENSSLYGIPYDDLQQLMETNAEIAMLYRRILEHALISSQVHADSQRFENATERYQRLLNTKPEILLRAPMVHIASYLQMTPETLSRVRAANMAEEISKDKDNGISGLRGSL
ncbi:MAG: Crp/Fnr family transcriptional regulator [Paraprevotella sp.]|jgi:cyclic nucleotide-binding domain protein|nr:Crp/Fnr family transcriptional regulator [Paraprevotella sp.]